MAQEENGARLDQLFRVKLTEMAAELEASARNLHEEKDVPASAERARYIGHRLHGTGAMYGYPLMSEVGRALEEVMASVRDGLPPPAPVAAGLVDQAVGLLEQLREMKGSPDDGAKAVANYTWACQRSVHESGAAGDEAGVA
jgi:chemotaxis protein histidine kinase CheA